MATRRFSLLQKVAALVPLFLLLVYLPGQMMLRCRIDGQLRDVCCCPQDGERESSTPVVRAQDCCDREVTHSQRPLADAARVPSHDFAAVVSFVVAVAPDPLLLAPSETFDRAAQRHGPVYQGPPLVLLKHAFLI